MAKYEGGFASMDPERQREVASKGGKAAHKQGRAHQWVGGTEEHLKASRKGGLASRQRVQAQHKQTESDTESEAPEPE